MHPRTFDYFSPASLDDALALLSKHQNEAKLLAGGQSLLSLMKLRLASPQVVIDLGSVPGLSFIKEDDGKIAIGALTTYADIKESQLLKAKCPLLPETASVIGDVQVRNRGTLGGSLAHADPAGDMPAAALALRAELKAVGPKGERWIRAEDFFATMYTTDLRPDEILTEIRVPKLDNVQSAYLKNARRPSDFAIVAVAVCLKLRSGTCDDITMGVTGITDKAYRPYPLENALTGKKLDSNTIRQECQTVADGVEIIENVHASKEIRADLARLYAARALEAALERTAS